MSNHVTLLADLDVGLSCSGEAAAAIRDLEAEVKQLQAEIERLRGILDKVFPRYTASDWALLDEAENLIAEFDAAKTPPQEQSNE